MDQKAITRDLRKAEVLQPDEEPVWQMLPGGVSSDIWLIKTPLRQMVVKQALPKLKVRDNWQADIRRNLAEQRFNAFLSKVAPEANAPLLYASPREAYFVMPYFGPPWESWKSKLLNGEINLELCAKAASLLAKIHNEAYQHQELADDFDNMEDFQNLRLNPYLETTAKRHPALSAEFSAEVERLRASKITLIHGDFSPKNLLVNQNDLLLIDHEVACFGAPSFDLAFFINHLMLKSLLFRHLPAARQMALVAWSTYFDEINLPGVDDLAKHTSRLWLMLFLARVDGKSPVEYLEDDHKTFIRSFVHEYLGQPISDNFPRLHKLFYQH